MSNENEQVIAMTKWLNWNKEWPTTPGHYWFYGRRHKQEGEREIFFVEVAAAGENLQHRLYSCHGMFLYKSDGAKGLWMKAILPPIPTEKQLEELDE
ncbi:MAG: hypothetical protein ACYSUN_11045 [Planctomycetota bacterium]|jgi:hypothetical protein